MTQGRETQQLNPYKKNKNAAPRNKLAPQSLNTLQIFQYQTSGFQGGLFC